MNRLLAGFVVALVLATSADAAKSPQSSSTRGPKPVPACSIAVVRVCPVVPELHVHINQSVLVAALSRELCRLSTRYTVSRVEVTCTGAMVFLSYVEDGQRRELQVVMPINGSEPSMGILWGAHQMVNKVNAGAFTGCK